MTVILSLSFPEPDNFDLDSLQSFVSFLNDLLKGVSSAVQALQLLVGKLDEILNRVGNNEKQGNIQKKSFAFNVYLRISTARPL